MFIMLYKGISVLDLETVGLGGGGGVRYLNQSN